MKEYVLEKLKELGNVKERTIEQYAKIDKNGMHFIIDAYEIEGIGYCSFIKMKAMLGLMKMDTMVFTPITKDMPLLSYDYIKTMGNETLLLELYNTNEEIPNLDNMNIVKEKYKHLKDHDLGKHWYDDLKLSPTLAKKGKKMTEEYKKLSIEWIDSYFALLANANSIDKSMKQKKTAIYVDGLFEHGGPSTDQFIKMIGKEDAYNLFTKYVFSSKCD